MVRQLPHHLMTDFDISLSNPNVKSQLSNIYMFNSLETLLLTWTQQLVLKLLWIHIPIQIPHSRPRPRPNSFNISYKASFLNFWLNWWQNQTSYQVINQTKRTQCLNPFIRPMHHLSNPCLLFYTVQQLIVLNDWFGNFQRIFFLSFNCQKIRKGWELFSTSRRRRWFNFCSHDITFV